jgi:hypothetical protein
MYKGDVSGQPFWWTSKLCARLNSKSWQLECSAFPGTPWHKDFCSFFPWYFMTKLECSVSFDTISVVSHATDVRADHHVHLHKARMSCMYLYYLLKYKQIWVNNMASLFSILKTVQRSVLFEMIFLHNLCFLPDHPWCRILRRPKMSIWVKLSRPDFDNSLRWTSLRSMHLGYPQFYLNLK